MTINDIILKFKSEPVVFLTLLVPLISLLAAFGLSLSSGQIVAVGGFVTAVTSLLARNKVTPVDPDVIVDKLTKKGIEL